MHQQMVRQLDHDALALGRADAPSPAVIKGRAGDGHSGRNVGFAATGHGGQQATIDRRNAVECLAAACSDAVATDECAAIT